MGSGQLRDLAWVLIPLRVQILFPRTSTIRYCLTTAEVEPDNVVNLIFFLVTLGGAICVGARTTALRLGGKALPSPSALRARTVKEYEPSDSDGAVQVSVEVVHTTMPEGSTMS